MKILVLLLALVGACLGNALPGGISEDAVKPMPLLKVDPLPGVPVQKPGRIISGTPAGEGQFPNQVGLHFNNAWFCGGSLITRCTILTAAHCTNGMDTVNVYLGSTTLLGGTRIVSTDYVQHPEYDGSKLINDVALVFLPSAVSGPNIGLVAGLAASNVGNYAGQTAIASGWGITKDGGSLSNVLNWVNVNIITPDACGNVYGTNARHDSVICSQAPGNNGVCSGDSGGPLIHPTTRIQIGVMSFAAAAGCERGLPSGYARVSHLRAWIDANTRHC